MFLIGVDGEKIGVKNIFEVIEIVKDSKMDLVLIVVELKLIVRILDYGKFKYECKKK